MAKRRPRYRSGRKAIGGYATNPHAYLVRFGFIGEGHEWQQWVIAHGGLIDLEPRDPHVVDFVDQASFDLAERLGARIDRNMFYVPLK